MNFLVGRRSWSSSFSCVAKRTSGVYPRHASGGHALLNAVLPCPDSVGLPLSSSGIIREHGKRFASHIQG
jgi:hypothetical protein